MPSIEKNNIRILATSSFALHVSGINNLNLLKGLECQMCKGSITAPEMHEPIPYQTCKMQSIKSICLLGEAYLRGTLDLYIQTNQGEEKERYKHIKGTFEEMERRT